MSQQDMIFNEACLREEVVAHCELNTARHWFDDFAELLRQMSRHRRMNRLRIHPEIRQRVLGEYPFSRLLNSKESPLPETVRQIIASRIESAPYLEETQIDDDRGVLEWEGRYYEFQYRPLNRIVHGLGAAYLGKHCAVSILTEDEHWDADSVLIDSFCILGDEDGDQSDEGCLVQHASTIEHLGIPKRTYKLTEKHKDSGWGTTMDLSDEEGQELLETAIEIKDKSAVYNYSPTRRKVYEFRPDNLESPAEYHGYPIPGAESVQALRVLRREDIIDEAEYERLRKQSSLD